MCILGLSKGDKQLILHTHNKYRGEVEKYGQPEPSNMLEMVTKRLASILSLIMPSAIY